MPSKYTLGNNIQTQITYNNFGLQEKIAASSIQDLRLEFDLANGNLKSRRDALRPGLTESFLPYDNLNRLTNVTGPFPIAISYKTDGTGRIDQKSDAGTYSLYDPNHLDAVKEVTNIASSAISHNNQVITYTAFNKTESVSENNNLLELTYGPDQQRKKTILTNTISGNTLATRIFYPGYEKTTSGSNTTEIYYINSPTGLCAMYVVENGVGHMYYVYTDHLGSFLKLTDASGAIIAEQSFDAWGRNRNPNDWSYNLTNAPVPSWLYRGFTGHEHLPLFTLINMNGRCYDPVLGVMLSPDNYLPDATSTKGFNRYCYAFGNPMSFTDPDGNNPLLFILAAAAIFGYLGGSAAEGGQFNPFKWTWSSKTWAGIGIGAACGALGGWGFSAAAPALAQSAFFSSFANGTVVAYGLAGTVIGGAAGYATGFGAGYIATNSWEYARKAGAAYGGIGAAIGAIGGTIDGFNAQRKLQEYYVDKKSRQISVEQINKYRKWQQNGRRLSHGQLNALQRININTLDENYTMGQYVYESINIYPLKFKSATLSALGIPAFDLTTEVNFNGITQLYNIDNVPYRSINFNGQGNTDYFNFNTYGFNLQNPTTGVITNQLFFNLIIRK